MHNAQVFEAFLSRPSRCVVKGFINPIIYAGPPLFLGHPAVLERSTFRGSLGRKEVYLSLQE